MGKGSGARCWSQAPSPGAIAAEGEDIADRFLLNEEIVGFLYLGTREGAAKTLPALEPQDYLSRW